MPFYIAAAIFFFLLFLIVFIYQQTVQADQKNSRRLNEVLGNPAVATVREKELRKPFYQRTIKPLLGKISWKFIKMMPAEKEAELSRQLKYANLQTKITARELFVIKYILAALSVVFFLFLGMGKQLHLVFIFVVLGAMIGWYGPNLYLRVKGRERQRAIEKDLPDVLDLLTVSVEAGLGFDGALLKVVEKSKGPLAAEFNLTLQEIRMGKPRCEALRDLSGRTGVEDLSIFTGAVIMADQLGLSIANVLRTQAAQIRMKRRQRAEEAAMKAPIKMLFPLVFFIFPAIFVVLLGPAAIQITRLFQ